MSKMREYGFFIPHDLHPFLSAKQLYGGVEGDSPEDALLSFLIKLVSNGWCVPDKLPRRDWRGWQFGSLETEQDGGRFSQAQLDAVLEQLHEFIGRSA